MGDQDSAAKRSDPHALADSKAPVSGAPATDDIDSEWSTEAAPASASVASESAVAASKPPRTEEVDSGWLGDGEPDAAALTKPNFPEDPAVPADVAAPASEKPKTAASSEPPAAAKKAVASASSAGRPAAGSERAPSKRKVGDASEARRVSQPSEPVATQKGGSRWIGLLLLGIAAGGVLVVKGRGQKDEPVAAEPAPAARPPEVTAAQTPRPEPDTAPAASAAVVAEAPAPVASESAPAPASAAPAEAAPAPSQAASEAAASAGMKRVVIDVMPPEARVYYRGKSVGKPPVTIELEPGKRRSFEVAAPGYTTRKIVVDGSKAEMSVGLRPVPASTDAARTP